MDYTNPKVKIAGEVVQSFITISRTLTKFSTQNAGSLGLTLQQMGVLNTIGTFPEITPKEITDKLSLPKSTVSVIVDSLVNLKLIEREISEENRREIHLTATPKGTELSKKSSENALSYKAMISVIEKMAEEEICNLLRIHKEILGNLKACKF